MTRKILLGIVFVVLSASLLTLALAQQTFTIESIIGGDSMRAESNLGRFSVGSGGKAYGFSGSSAVIGWDGKTTRNFLIQKVGAQTETVFERNVDGVTDSLVALSSLVLGPGKYVLVIGGKAGGRATITFTGVNVTVGW